MGSRLAEGRRSCTFSRSHFRVFGQSSQHPTTDVLPPTIARLARMSWPPIQTLRACPSRTPPLICSVWPTFACWNCRLTVLRALNSFPRRCLRSRLLTVGLPLVSNTSCTAAAGFGGTSGRAATSWLGNSDSSSANSRSEACCTDCSETYPGIARFRIGPVGTWGDVMVLSWSIRKCSRTSGDPGLNSGEGIMIPLSPTRLRPRV